VTIELHEFEADSVGGDGADSHGCEQLHSLAMTPKDVVSIERIEKIVKNTKARLVVQHDPQDFQALPQFPAYLD
jgi:hypothetical protein